MARLLGSITFGEGVPFIGCSEGCDVAEGRIEHLGNGVFEWHGSLHLHWPGEHGEKSSRNLGVKPVEPTAKDGP